MTFELNEEILKKALLLELEERVDAYPEEYDKPHVFSKRFNLSMCLFKKYRKIATQSIRHWFNNNKRALIVWFAMVILLAALKIGIKIHLQRTGFTSSLTVYKK